MRALWLALSVGTALALQAQENSQSRLDAAESGAKDVSWPRRPDNRSSPLSGKMKDFREIPSQEYGGAKEFRSERLYEDRQASSLASVPPKSMAESAFAKKSDTSFVKDSALADQDIQHASDSVFFSQEAARIREERDLSRPEATGWSSRSSRTGQSSDGALQMYDGRLTRVRQRVNREATSTDRDLGEGRREKYNPEEVQKLLKQKPGLPEIQEMVRPALPVRAESPAASRPLAAGS
ncbi:MAG: hypothetical protein EBT57_03195 [Verrucomicrobia bacterium]|nr:hypothetical protein [Verrucomicrobiota bacterium]